MFIKNKDLALLKKINKEINNDKLCALITRLEKDMTNNGNVAKEKINYMRTHGYPYYARSRKVQEKHYRIYIKEISYYLEYNEIDTAMGILKRIIKENSYTPKQLEYFMGTIPNNILEIYKSYSKNNSIFSNANVL